MPFTLLVCGDLFSEKVNLELPFPEKPTLPELKNHVQNSFTAEMRCLQPPNMPAIEQFNVNRIQVYDDAHLKWVDLSSPQQLHEYDQLYCFQPVSPWQTDVQKDLPAPRPPTRPVALSQGVGQMAPQSGMAPSISSVPVQQQVHQINQSMPPPGGYYAQPSPQGHMSHNVSQLNAAAGMAQPVGAASLAGERPNVPLEERVRVSFQELDDQHKGWIESAELERAFRNRGIDFSASTVNELFVKADHPRDGRIDMQKWHVFAQIYPNTVDAVYYRGRDMRSEQGLRDDITQAQRELDAGRAKEQELRQAADAQAQHNQRLMAMLQDNEARMRANADRRNLLEGQERALIEQEVKLERQKDALRISMSKFKETASAFDRDAAQNGSPRRSRAPAVDIPGL